MKRTFVSLALLAGLAAPAAASDLNGSLKDGGSTFAPQSVNWTGFYIGGSLGYGHANHNLSIHDYFKEYCGDSSQAEQHGFDDPDLDDRQDQIEDGVLAAGACAPGEAKLLSGHNDVLVDGDSREIASIDGINSSGLVGDGRIGFDVQRGRFVGGIFASYGFNDMSTDVSFGGTTIKAIEKGDEWSIGARAGLLVNERTLAYILAAYTESEFSFAGIGTNGGNKDVTFSGVTIGGGVEFALTRNVFLGVEGTHTFYGEETLLDVYDAEENRGFRLKDEIGETKVMGTLKVKLNSGLGGALE